VLDKLGAEALPATPELIEFVQRHDPAGIPEGIALLAGMGAPAAKALPVLRKIARSKEKELKVRVAAIRAIPALVGGRRHAVPDLLICLRDKATEIRDAALLALGSMGPDAAGAVKALRRILKRRNPPAPDALRVSIVGVLSGMGEKGLRAVPELVALLPDDSERVRLAAATALVRFGEVTGPTIACLTGLLDSADPETRTRAATLLGDLGEIARELVPRLKKMADDDGSRKARGAARKAVKSLEGD